MDRGRTGESGIAWTDGHHGHVVPREGTPHEETLASLIELAGRWMSDNLVAKTLYRDGRKTQQSVRFLDTTYPDSIVEWNESFGIPKVL